MQTMEEVLGSHPFFAGLNAGAMRPIAGCATNVHFAEGEFLFAEGHEAPQFWVIRRGRVAMQLGKCEAGPELGYQLLKRGTSVMYQRLQSTRIRLLDLYGTEPAQA